MMPIETYTRRFVKSLSFCRRDTGVAAIQISKVKNQLLRGHSDPRNSDLSQISRAACQRRFEAAASASFVDCGQRKIRRSNPLLRQQIRNQILPLFVYRDGGIGRARQRSRRNQIRSVAWKNYALAFSKRYNRSGLHRLREDYHAMTPPVESELRQRLQDVREDDMCTPWNRTPEFALRAGSFSGVRQITPRQRTSDKVGLVLTVFNDAGCLSGQRICRERGPPRRLAREIFRIRRISRKCQKGIKRRVRNPQT